MLRFYSHVRLLEQGADILDVRGEVLAEWLKVKKAFDKA